MINTLVNGSIFRLFKTIDDFKREPLAVDILTSMPSLKVNRELNRIIELVGRQPNLRPDIGPEFISNELQE